jgi:Leucine-rich repeat (LRR) protein
LTSLPEALGDLHALRVLDLRDNALGMIPESLVHMPRLRSLDLRENPLRDLPPLPESLEKLDLRWTPFFPDLPPAALAVRERGGIVLH